MTGAACPRNFVLHENVRYGEYKAVFGIEGADIIAGQMPSRQTRLVQAWMELHREELVADWLLAVEGNQPYKIEPLR